jgi:hypothetical protein
VGGHGTCDVPNAVKPKNAALGFRVKSGWAAVAVISGPPLAPQLCDVRRIELSDPRFSETQQPYHASTGQLETDKRKIDQRVRVVRSIAERSIATLLGSYRQNGYTISRAGIVVGSKVDPASITNPHIRAHACEGQLFRSVLEDSLQAQSVSTQVLLERDAYAQAALKRNLSDENVRSLIRRLGRETEAPWRAEQKIAAVAAWFTLA